MMPPQQQPGIQGWQGPASGYSNQQPSIGYPPAGPPIQQQQQQQWDPSSGHASTMGHNDYPSPGEIHLTMKQYVTRMAIMLLIGIIIGGIIMFRLFPIFVRVVQATADSAGASLIVPLWRFIRRW